MMSVAVGRIRLQNRSISCFSPCISPVKYITCFTTLYNYDNILLVLKNGLEPTNHYNFEFAFRSKTKRIHAKRKVVLANHIHFCQII